MIGPADLLQLAERWIEAPIEAEWRSAVSRAYYAAFHEARRRLRQLGFEVPRGEGAHAYLSLRLSNCGTPPLQDAGYTLNSLRRERNRADYDIDRVMRQSDGRVQVAAARSTVDTLAVALPVADRNSLVDAIRRYETDVLREPTWHN